MPVFKSFGEQLQAVRRAGLSEGIDPRLSEVQRRATPIGASEKVPSDGGFAVEETWATAVFKRLYLTGQILRRCAKLPVTKGNTLNIQTFDERSRVSGSRLGGIQCYTLDESQTIQTITPGTFSQKPTFVRQALTMKKYVVLLDATDELVEDSSALGAWAQYAFTQEASFRIEYDIVNGTGAGQILGILSAPGTITVPKTSGQTTATVNADNVIAMLGQLWAAADPETTAWLYNPQLLETLMQLTVSVGSGGSELRLWSFRSGTDPYDRLCGIPALKSEYCQVPGTPGDLVLADWGRVLFAAKEPRTDVSDQLQVLFDANQSAFRFVWRCDAQLVDVTPVTPAFGSTPTSTAVCLAQRS